MRLSCNYEIGFRYTEKWIAIGNLITVSASDRRIRLFVLTVQYSGVYNWCHGTHYIIIVYIAILTKFRRCQIYYHYHNDHRYRN